MGTNTTLQISPGRERGTTQTPPAVFQNFSEIGLITALKQHEILFPKTNGMYWIYSFARNLRVSIGSYWIVENYTTCIDS